MSNISDSDRIDDVSAGDIVTVDRGPGPRPFKVVHKQATDSGEFVVTFEDDSDGETFEARYAAGTPVTRALESKWESPQSPTPHS